MLERIAAIGCALSLLASGASGQDADPNVYARDGAYVAAGAVFGNPRFNDVVRKRVRNVVNLDPRLEGTSSIDWGVGFNATAGYRFHPHLAAEVQYEYIDEQGMLVFAGIDEFKEAQATEIIEKEVQRRRPEHVATANARLFITKGRAQPYAKVGAGVMRGSLEKTGSATVVGGLRDARQPAQGGTGITCSDTTPCPIEIPGLGATAVHTEFAMRFGAGLDLYITEHVVFNASVDYVIPLGELHDLLDYVSFGVGLAYRF